MGIAVLMAVAEFLHQLRWRIAQMHRHLARLVLFDEGACLVVRHIAGVALGGDGQIDHRLPQRQLAFRRAEALEGGCRVVGDLHRARIGQPDILPRHAHDAPRQVARVGAAIQHPAQPVQRGIRVRAAHRFVQRRNLVVEIVAALVEAARVQCQCLLQEGGADRGRSGGAGRGLHLFEQIQETAGVTVGITDQRIDGGIVELQRRQRLVARARQQLAQLVVTERFQHIDLGARQQRGVDLERRVFGRGADKGHQAGFDIRQQRVLL